MDACIGHWVKQHGLPPRPPPFVADLPCASADLMYDTWKTADKTRSAAAADSKYARTHALCLGNAFFLNCYDYYSLLFFLEAALPRGRSLQPSYFPSTFCCHSKCS